MTKKARLSDYLFLLPAFIIYTSVIMGSTAYTTYISFFKWNGIGPKKYVGLQNYVNLFTKDKIFRISLYNNLEWISLTLVISMGIALGLALIFNLNFKGRTFFRSYFYFPYTLSFILTAIVWRKMYDPSTGFINEFLRGVGLDDLTSTWTADPDIALYCIFAAAAWQGIGQPMILFLTGLQTVNSEVIEAAKIDGANTIQTLFRVIFPLMKETFIIVFAILIIASMKVYDVVLGMTGGGPANSTQTLGTYMRAHTFLYSHFGIGTAIAVVMLVLMLLIIVPYMVFMARTTD
ncbi:MAG: sugar ABC transporter permease [Spirochaetaceae bacterium]|nr:MAG: sugar ABC transporter permease [Spirochaetaceae bacterium]